ncbi:MAG: PEGA domain-containing protein [Pseudomonadota bacterium]
MVVPTGEHDALFPTLEVSQALVKHLNRGKQKTELGYILPQNGAQEEAISSADEAKQAYEWLGRAFGSFEVMDFAATYKNGHSALTLFQKIIQKGGPTNGYVRTLHLLAASALFEGDEPAAILAMNDAILFDPLPPLKTDFNPTVQELHTRVIEQIDLAGQGSIDLNTSVPAIAWINGKILGHAKASMDVRAGLYFLQIYSPGYKLYQNWFRVDRSSVVNLSVVLQKCDACEAPIMTALRQEARDFTPGKAVAKVQKRLQARELVLVSSGESCTPAHCLIMMRWAKDESWFKRKQVLYRGDAKEVAIALLTDSRKQQAVAAKIGGPTSCENGNLCPHTQGHNKGFFFQKYPIFKKWWFWTAVGVVATGVVVGIAVGVNQPEQPTIVVR